MFYIWCLTIIIKCWTLKSKFKPKWKHWQVITRSHQPISKLLMTILFFNNALLVSRLHVLDLTLFFLKIIVICCCCFHQPLNHSSLNKNVGPKFLESLEVFENRHLEPKHVLSEPKKLKNVSISNRHESKINSIFLTCLIRFTQCYRLYLWLVTD